MTFDKNTEFFEKKVEILKALAHPVRLCIVKGLMGKGGCNVTYMQECLSIPQSTISQHIGRLKAAGILKGNRKGLEITYYVASEDAKKIINALF